MKSQLAVFFSYAPADDHWQQELEKHLSLLKREGLIAGWHQRAILAGQEVAQAIDANFTSAGLILLLVSPDFLASDYCWGVEMQRAMERHEAGEAVVIPIIVRPVDWRTAIFARLQALPTDGKPITSALWHSTDDALFDVAQGIRKMVEALRAKPLPMTSSQVWTISYPRNPFFTGREEVLKSVHDTLQAGQPTALAQAQAISGLGGIGKTQTAVEYAYRYRTEYRFVLWAKADTPETLNTDLLTIATRLNLPEKDAQDQALVVATVKRWLSEHRTWLLILDNADDLTLVRDLLPPVHAGHILLTTRASAMGRLAQRIELDTMEPEEGAQLLLRRANLIATGAPSTAASEADHRTAEAIVQELGGLPLALDQAGAYIEETNCSLLRYLTLYQTRRASLLKRRGGLVDDHPEPVATTWSLSFERVEQVNPLASDLLRFCALLYPEDIPEELITRNAAQLGPVLQAIHTEPLALDDAIAALLNYSLLRRTSEKGTLSIHRLVQAVLKDGMDSVTQRQWAERAVRAVNRSFPPSEVETWPACQLYLPHALVCAAHIAQWELATTEAANLLFQAGYYLEDRGQYEQAEPLYQRALTTFERVLGAEHPDTLNSVNSLAGLYWRQGKYEQAEPLLQRALTTFERLLGAEHPDTLGTVNNLAVLYWNQGKYEQAEPLYQRALTTKERVLGPEHPSTLHTVNNLANLYADQGKYEQAEPLYQRALTTYERVLGPEHPDTLNTVNNLAVLYRKQGKYEQAESLYQRALTTYERVLGPEHPDTLNTVNNLAILYRNQGKYEQAEPLLQRALTTRERVLGPEHPDTVSTRENYTNLLQEMKKRAQAGDSQS